MTHLKNSLLESQKQPGSESEQPAGETFLKVVVSEDKALLREIKRYNKGGRPEMRIHEPRVRYNTGETIKLHPDEVLTDGSAIYYRCFDQPDLYVRKKDVTPV